MEMMSDMKILENMPRKIYPRKDYFYMYYEH